MVALHDVEGDLTTIGRSKRLSAAVCGIAGPSPVAGLGADLGDGVSRRPTLGARADAGGQARHPCAGPRPPDRERGGGVDGRAATRRRRRDVRLSALAARCVIVGLR